MYYLYLLRSRKDNKFYIGLTEDIKRRVEDHNRGKVESTRDRKPLDLIYYEYYLEVEDASGREKFLKSGSGHAFIKKQLRNYFLKNSGGEIGLMPIECSRFC